MNRRPFRPPVLLCAARESAIIVRMWSFPAITTTTGSWRFPLASHTAMGLYEVLTVGDSVRLRDWMALDPPLVLWSVCRLGDDAGCESLTSLAEAVGPHLPVWLGEPSADGARDGLRPKKRWVELVRASLRTATQSALAAGNCGVPSDSAYLLGLISEAPGWFASCGDSVTMASFGRGESPFPPRLARRLAACRRSSGGGATARVVYESRKRLRGAYRTEGAVEAASDVASIVRLWTGATAGDVRSADSSGGIATVWGSASDVPAACLVALAARSARLRKLETDFQHELESAKLAAIGQLAYGAGHEINNPLANISSRAQTLLREESDPHRRHQLATIVAQAFRAHEMIADLMLYAKPPDVKRHWISVTDLLDQGVSPWREAAERQQTTLHVETRRAGRVHVDSAALATAIGALVRNALEALGASGDIWVEALCEGGELEVRVRDTGPGISDEVRRHMFDPYYSGREAGRGHGFGLSKVWVVVSQHGGRIDVASAVGEGAEFVMRLPTPRQDDAPSGTSDEPGRPQAVEEST